MTRKEHLRHYLVEIAREAGIRAMFQRGRPPLEIFEAVWSAMRDEVKAEFFAVVADLGLEGADRGLEVRGRAGERLLDEAVRSLRGRIRGGSGGRK